MKQISTVILAILSFSSLAATAVTNEAPRRVSSAEIHARRQIFIERQGGEVLKRGTYLGSVVLVNASGIASAECEQAVKICATASRCNVRLANDGKGANAVVTVINDPNAPRLLVATEEHWAKVNLANLMNDLPSSEAREKFFSDRARRLIVKALAMVMGSWTSDYPGNLMSAAQLRDLEKVPDGLPADVIQRCDRHLKSIGVTRRETTTYYKAVMEGWAPAPTNDVQRKIWEKAHQIPSNPIKITK